MKPLKIFRNICILLILFLSIIPLANPIPTSSNVHFTINALNVDYITNKSFNFSSIDVYNNGLYLNGSIFKHVPDTGSITVYIEDYNPPNYIKYKINTTGAVTTVNNTVGGLNNSELYSIHVDGSFWKAVSTNSTGVLMFNYSSWSNHTFEILKSANVVCEQYVYNNAGNTVSYNWGNWTATGGATKVGNYSDASQTYIKATNNGSADGTATISWNYGTLNNSTNTINIDNNVKYVYGTGTTPSDVTSWTYSAVDNDHTFQVTVPASSTLWVYYEIQNIGAVPAGEYTQSFTWTTT